jgi:hypothetical protein
MTTSKKSSQHIYDYAIIGSGLSGLCIANALSKVTSNLILIDGGDTFGGFNRSIQNPLGLVNNGLRFLPSSELAQKSLAFVEMLLLSSLNAQHSECPPISYEAGGLRPFVGFGENPPPFYEELNYFAASERLYPHLEPHEWTQLLFNNYSGDFSPRSFVTKFNGENGQISSVTINGQKKINALNWIYCGPVRSLAALLPEDALSAKAKLKLKKNQYWTAVCLDLLHSSKVTDSRAVHILNGTTQDDLGPCAGQFLTTDQQQAQEDQPTPQYSQWMTFVDSEESENTEVIGAALKKIKRQIKRAYPEALENLQFERILVVPDFAGNGDIKLNANQSLPVYGNFWVGSGVVSKQKNILGSLSQAELICASLGCHPLGTQVETSVESATAEA